MAEEDRTFGLRAFADVYEATVKVRIAAENRLRAVEQGADAEGKPKIIASHPLLERFYETEEETKKYMLDAFAAHPCFRWLMGVPGIQQVTACRILGIIDDPVPFAHFSNLRSFSGYAPGKDRLVKGQRATFSLRLKTSIHVAAESLLKAAATTGQKNRPEHMYDEIYRWWRGEYLRRFGAGSKAKCEKKKNGVDTFGNRYIFPDEDARKWPDGRQHLAALRKMKDVFLYHIYEEWLHKLGKKVPVKVDPVDDSIKYRGPRDSDQPGRPGHHAKYERTEFSSPVFAKKKMGAKRFAEGV